MARRGYNANKHRMARKEKGKKALFSAARWFGRKGWKLLLVLAVLGVAVWQGWFWVSKLNPVELRTLRTVDVSGNRMLTWEEILQTAGLETGMPMSEIDADSVRERLLSLPLVQDARVDVGLFWNVSVHVEETVPVMEVLENGHWKAYSGRGQKFPVASSSILDLPVASVVKNREIKKIAAFLQTMRKEDEALYRSVSQVALDEKLHAMVVCFRDVKFKVLFPLDRPADKSFGHYRLLVKGLPQEMKTAKSLDLRFDGFAYVNPAKEVK